MKKIIFISLLLMLFSLSTYAQNNAGIEIGVFPANLKTDGCSLFPDGDYRDCCVEHDKVYYVGGSWKKRWQTDKQLMKCVSRKEGWWHKPLAPIIWAGVRIGGVPFLQTSFRWGFGRNKPKKDHPQSKEVVMKKNKISKPTGKKSAI